MRPACGGGAGGAGRAPGDPRGLAGGFFCFVFFLAGGFGGLGGFWGGGGGGLGGRMSSAFFLFGVRDLWFVWGGGRRHLRVSSRYFPEKAGVLKGAPQGSLRLC